jgi:hypothetical protein
MILKNLILIIVSNLLFGAFAIRFDFQLPQLPPHEATSFTINNHNGNYLIDDGQKTFNELAFNSSNFTGPLAEIIKEVEKFHNISNYQQWFLPSDYRQLSNYTNNNSLPFLEMRSSLQSAIEQYSSALNSSLSQGFEQTQKVFTELSEFAITAIQMSNNVVTTTLVEIESQVNRYSKTVADCVEENAGGYRQVLPKARDVTIDCVYTKYQQGLSIIFGTRNDTIEALNGGRQLGENVNNCTTKASGQVACILKAIANINRNTILLPIQMTKRYSEASEYIDTIKSDIMNCGAKVVDAVVERSLNVTQSIATCLIQE